MKSIKLHFFYFASISLLFFASDSQASSIGLKLDYQSVSSTDPEASASTYLLFSDESFLLQGRSLEDYWDLYLSDDFDDWYNRPHGIVHASITVQTSLENGGEGTFTYEGDELKEFYWSFKDPSNLDRSSNLADQLSHFAWYPVDYFERPSSHLTYNEAPISYQLDFGVEADGFFYLYTNGGTCGKSCDDFQYGVNEGVYDGWPNGHRPTSIRMELTAASLDLTPVPLPGSVWLFSGAFVIFTCFKKYQRNRASFC